MARVPVSPGNRVALQPLPAANFRAADFGSAGQAIGQGAEGLGRQMGATAETMQRLAEVRAEEEARRWDTEQMEAIRPLRERVRQARGINARAVADEAAKELEKLNSDLVAQASTPLARKMLQQSLRKRSVQELDTWSTHATAQEGEAIDSGFASRAEGFAETALDYADDPVVREQNVAAGVNEIRQRAQWRGWDEATRDQEIAKFVSRVRIGQAQKIARRSAAEASDFVMAHRNEISDAESDKFLNSYQNEALNEWAESGFDRYLAPPAQDEPDPLAPKPDGPDSRSGEPVRPVEEQPLDITRGRGIGSGFGPRAAPATAGGRRGSSNHKGWDLQYRTGEAVEATMSGVARVKDDPDGFGRYVVVDHGNGLETLYGHLSAYSVRDGQRVRRGETVGRAGSSGNSSGPHLHYEARRDGQSIDPATLGRETVYYGGSGSRANVAASDSDAPFDLRTTLSRIENDSSLSYKQRQALKGEAKRRYVEWEGVRSNEEQQAAREVESVIGGLGDGFTDVTQLGSAFTRLSPSAQNAYRNAAKANREGKPVSAETEARIGFLQTFRPESFAETETRQWLAKQGVPPSRIADLARVGGGALGQEAGKPTPTPKPVATGRLESIARPAFEAAGIMLWTRPAGGKKAELDRQTDAQTRIRVLEILNTQANAWAQNNPGKVADDATVKRWVANTLRQTQGGRMFELSNKQIVDSISAKNRATIVGNLKAAGLPATVGNVGDYFRRWYIGNR